MAGRGYCLGYKLPRILHFSLEMVICVLWLRSCPISGRMSTSLLSKLKWWYKWFSCYTSYFVDCVPIYKHDHCQFQGRFRAVGTFPSSCVETSFQVLSQQSSGTGIVRAASPSNGCLLESTCSTIWHSDLWCWHQEQKSSNRKRPEVTIVVLLCCRDIWCKGG